MNENLNAELVKYKAEIAELKKEIAGIREKQTGKKRYSGMCKIVDEKAEDPRIKHINLRIIELNGLIDGISKKILLKEMRGYKK